MSKVLGIDQSYTSCGLCVAENSVLLAFERFKTDPKADVYDRSIEVANHIVGLVKLHAVTQVNIEGLAFGMRGNATRDLAGLIFVIITSLRRECPGVVTNVIAPTSLKKHATGSGKADKAAMITALPAEIREKFDAAGFKKTTGLTDMTDSYWLSMVK